MKSNLRHGKAGRFRQYVKASRLGYEIPSFTVKDTPTKQVWADMNGKTIVHIKVPFWEAMA